MASKTPVARRTRGPAIARKTEDGRPTAYAVMKDIWSHRGEVVNKTEGNGDKGVIVKRSAIRILEGLDKEAAAPFKAKKQGDKLVLVAA